MASPWYYLQLDKQLDVEVICRWGIDMAKEKIVRCKVSKVKDGMKVESVRYIPLGVYHLWKILMMERHNFTIEDDYVSLWFDIDGDPNVTYPDANYEKLVKICLSVFSEEAGMFREIIRYFPSDTYDRIRPLFLSHYSKYFNESTFPPKMQETRGVWLKREDH
jgi:hypothetical protein